MESQHPCLLIVEGDVLVRSLLNDALEDDYKVICAATNRDALAIMIRQRIDVILFDYHLRDVPGENLLERAGEATIPVIGMTDRVSDFKPTSIVHHPMLLKPFTLATVLRALAQACNTNETGRIATDKPPVIQFKLH